MYLNDNTIFPFLFLLIKFHYPETTYSNQNIELWGAQTIYPTNNMSFEVKNMIFIPSHLGSQKQLILTFVYENI